MFLFKIFFFWKELKFKCDITNRFLSLLNLDNEKALFSYNHVFMCLFNVLCLDDFNDVTDLWVKIINILLISVRIIFLNIVSDCFFYIECGYDVIASRVEDLDNSVVAGEQDVVLGVCVELSEVKG